MSEEQPAITAEEYAAWLTPDAAVNLLEHLDEITARLAIFERLKYGHIRAVARRYNFKGKSGEFIAIPNNIWVAAEMGIAESTLWSTGDIFLAIPEHSPAYGYRVDTTLPLFGIRFDPAGVRELQSPVASATKPVDPAPLVHPATINKGGGPPKQWWDDLWVEVARQLYTGDLQPKKQVDIENAMLDWVSAHSHDASPATIRNAARKLWRAVHGEGKN